MGTKGRQQIGESSRGSSNLVLLNTTHAKYSANDVPPSSMALFPTMRAGAHHLLAVHLLATIALLSRPLAFPLVARNNAP